MITAAETCDFINEVVCKPANVKELFEFANFGSSQISRTEVLILLAELIGYRFLKNKRNPKM